MRAEKNRQILNGNQNWMWGKFYMVDYERWHAICLR